MPPLRHYSPHPADLEGAPSGQQKPRLTIHDAAAHLADFGHGAGHWDEDTVMRIFVETGIRPADVPWKHLSKIISLAQEFSGETACPCIH